MILAAGVGGRPSADPRVAPERQRAADVEEIQDRHARAHTSEASHAHLEIDWLFKIISLLFF